jgi:hypothetical protein
MQVAHRRLDVRVAHPLLHPPDVGLGDHPRAERVPQVVEAQRTEFRAGERGLVAAAERRTVEMAAGDAAEHRVVLADEVRPGTKPSQRLSHVRRRRDRPDLAGLGVVTFPSP